MGERHGLRGAWWRSNKEHCDALFQGAVVITDTRLSVKRYLRLHINDHMAGRQPAYTWAASAAPHLAIQLQRKLCVECFRRA